MEDSYIIANYHELCRFCLKKCSLMFSIYDTFYEEESSYNLITTISNCFEMQIHPNDGLPAKICFKCLYRVNECSEFKGQCINSERKLKQIVNNLNRSTLPDLPGHCMNTQVKTQKSIVEESVVMVVDPSMEYDTSEESEPEKTAQDVANNIDYEPTGDYLKNIFMCQYCDQAFVTQDKCTDHELSYHNPKLPFNCNECTFSFAERTQFTHHVKNIHNNDKPYRCQECDKSFGRRSDLRKHSIVHTGIRPYQCHYCFKSFSRNTNLSKHLRIHAGQKPHVCLYCPRSFVAKGDLQRHALIHTGMKPYSCRGCAVTFTRRDKLLKHESKHHPLLNHHPTSEDNSNMVVNVNPFCNLMSSSDINPNMNNLPRVPEHISGESSFINHDPKKTLTTSTVSTPPKVKVAMKNRPKNIKCHQCPKRFSSLDAYKTHVSIAHIGSRVFQCKKCFSKFVRKRDLDKHASQHMCTPLFQCTQCNEKFERKEQLLQHDQDHESVSNMPCIECGATFMKKVDLVAHIKSHFSDDFNDKCADIDSVLGGKRDLPIDDSLFNLET